MAFNRPGHELKAPARILIQAHETLTNSMKVYKIKREIRLFSLSSLLTVAALLTGRENSGSV